jgi:RloB-like protein
VLIVCEGEKTEPNYFEEIRKLIRISSAHIRIIQSENGTQPLQVVESAIEEFSKTKAYDRVYAVFDRDDHETYANAIHKAEAKKDKLKNDERRPVLFCAVASVPNFEFWLLLHFEDIREWLRRDEVYERLRRYIPDYRKNAADTYSTTEHLLGVASERAASLRVRFSRLPGKDAYTDVDKLVAFLRSLKRS